MGIGGISIWQLAIILLIVVLIFGTKKLKGMGKDLGGAVKGFKDAMGNEKEEQEDKEDEKLHHADKTSTDETHQEHREKSHPDNK